MVILGAGLRYSELARMDPVDIGVSLRDLQYRMGHASIRTTEKYLQAVEAAKQKDFVGAPF
jgi:integrase